MNFRTTINTDRTLAGVTALFVATILVMRWFFGLPSWDSNIALVYSFLTWVATLLVVATVVLGVLRLMSTDRTLTGSLLALAALVHAPLFMGMRFGLVDIETMTTFGRISQAVMYPTLGVLAVVVLVRSVFRKQRPPATAPHSE
jgi:hypothetical protein